MATGLMEVQVLKAKCLGKKDFFGKSDPYVLIQYKNQERKTSVASEQGSNPVWNEKFTFRVEYPGEGNQYKIALKIMDEDLFSRDDYLGQATIYVKDLLAQGVENGTAELRTSKYNVVRADGTYCGEIQAGVKFTKKQQQALDEDEIGGWKESEY